jgi:hypothetical protein
MKQEALTPGLSAEQEHQMARVKGQLKRRTSLLWPLI